MSVAVVRVKREAEDLVWDYQDVAGDLRRSDGTGTDLPDVVVVDLRHINGSTDVKKMRWFEDGEPQEVTRTVAVSR